jgi:DNA-binding CsgD family transcriptional regulator
MPGYLDRLERLCAVMRGRLADPPDLAHACYHLLNASCFLSRGDLAAAEREGELALAIARDCGQIVLVRAALCTTFALIAAGRARWADMESWCVEGLDDNKYGQIARNWRLHYLYLQARARWHAGNPEGLRRTYEDAMRPNPFEAPAAKPYLHLIRGILRTAERSYAQAEQSFREALREEDAYKVTSAISSARVLLAQLLLVRGQASDAMEVFGPYLDRAETANLTGHLLRDQPFVIPLLRHAHERKMRRGYVEHVLELLGAPLNAVEASGGEALSERELEVLRVMAEGLSNREIAARLFISEATVKTHVQRIMRKLDAGSRTQAAARARELLLL